MGAPLFAEALSVVKHPSPERGPLQIGVGLATRGPVLAAWGTRQREKELRELWHHEYNTIFRGAIAGLIKRVQSTPFEIKAPEDQANYWQRLLMNADFGNIERFYSKAITDYSRHDQGAFIELIAPGDPRFAPMGPVMGLAVLDSARCYPTGNPTYPVIYYDVNNKLHLLHRGRVVQFVDSEDSDESLPGYGECALSRCVAPVWRQIQIARYIEQRLDDVPPPGVSVMKNITESWFNEAVTRMEVEKQTDQRGIWGRNLRIYTLEMDNPPEIEHFTFATAPDSFDFEKFTVIDVRMIALGIGLDIQDIWELSGAGIGTGTQSQIMAQKSRGKAYGRILKSLERMINRALPEEVEFAFQYKDPQEDLEEAEKAGAWVATINSAGDGGILNEEEKRVAAANQIPAVRDVITDEAGQIKRLPDDDPKPPAIQEDTQGTEDVVSKAFDDISTIFSDGFAEFVRNSQDLGRGTLRAAMRNELNEQGTIAYNQGLRDGGEDPETADAITKADRRRTVAEWVAEQNPYVNKFVDDVLAGIDDAELVRRSELWANKSLRAIYYAGLADAAGDQLRMWVYDPEKEHCDTCLMLNGQIHPIREFMAQGYYPGSSALACGGFFCGCKWEKVPDGTLPRGAMPGAERERLLDRILNFVRRLMRRNKALASKGYPEFDPNQPRDERGRWTEIEGGKYRSSYEAGQRAARTFLERGGTSNAKARARDRAGWGKTPMTTMPKHGPAGPIPTRQDEAFFAGYDEQIENALRKRDTLSWEEAVRAAREQGDLSNVSDEHLYGLYRNFSTTASMRSTYGQLGSESRYSRQSRAESERQLKNIEDELIRRGLAQRRRVTRAA